MQALSNNSNLDSSSNDTSRDNINTPKGIAIDNAPRQIIAIENNSTSALTDSTSKKNGDTPIRQR